MLELLKFGTYYFFSKSFALHDVKTLFTLESKNRYRKKGGKKIEDEPHHPHC